MRTVIIILSLFIISANYSIAQTWQQLIDSSKIYSEKKDFGNALRFAQKAMPLCENELTKMDSNYIGIIEKISNFFSYLGNSDSSRYYQNLASRLSNELKQSNNPIAVFYLLGNAGKYLMQCRYNEAEKLYKKSLELYKKIYSGDNYYIINCYISLGAIYEMQGKLVEAETIIKEALDMSLRLYKSDNIMKAAVLNNMACIYKSLGKYTEAEPLFKESLAMYRRLLKEDNVHVAAILTNLAALYSEKGRYSEAEPYFNEALKINRKSTDANPYILYNLINIAVLYDVIDSNYIAEKLLIEALNIAKKLYKEDHYLTAYCLKDLGDLYEEIQKPTEAEKYYKEALDMFKRLYQAANTSVASTLFNFAYFYHMTKRPNESEALFIESLDMYIKFFMNNCINLSDNEKEKFWNTIKGNFESFNRFSVLRMNENPLILCNMFDYQLFTKGLLFNSSNRIRRRILNSGDSILISKYVELTDRKEQLIKLYGLTNRELNEKKLNIDSIELIVNELEKEVSLKSEDYKQSYEKKKLSWKTIQAVLKPDEAAVEIVRFRILDSNNIDTLVYYAALIINEETTEHPEMVLLKNGNDLEIKYYNLYRKSIKSKIDDTTSFFYYWGKIYVKLKNYKKIYLSPDGIYNKLNISSLKMPNGKYVLDIQDIQVLNSTNDILLGYYEHKKETNIYNSAELFGNPSYNSGPEPSKLRGRERSNKKNDLTSSKTRGGFELSELPGTEKEVNSIAKYLNGKKWDVKVHTKNSANKSVIKSINNPRVLHIATHGLFLSDINPVSEKTFGIEKSKIIGNPLLRSGIFLAGASSSIQGNYKPGIDDNGFLTAYEAMNLDLDKTELVVLSACETGLGEVRNGEGVFGLRRAFQQAGAKTVLMSLWTIDDWATQELMTIFYKEWVSGKTKQESFKSAQQELKKKYPEPYYWGSFVMVGE